MSASDVLQLVDFDRERLDREADALRKEYLAAKPWPHLVLRDVFPDDVVAAAAAECMAVAKTHETFGPAQMKEESPGGLGPIATQLLATLDSDYFKQFIEK